MENSSTGSRRSGDGQQDPPDPSPKKRIFHRLQLVADCLRRAADGLEREDETRIDWVYVTGQLTAANVFLIGAIEDGEQQAEHGSAKPATADMLDIADEVDLLIDQHAKKPAEGGVS